ncbi:MAG TPA: hypothetical protein PLN69_00090 [bacterium]|nr:hypothetical protein [bacterium]
MDEEKEKQSASSLGEYLEGRPAPEKTTPELEDALESAELIRGAFGGGPELNSVFSETLRARLVREAEIKQKRSRRSPLSMKWMQYAAAVVFIIIIPAVWAVRDSNERNRMALLEKYDKMYVPFSEKTDRVDYLAKHLTPFDKTTVNQTVTLQHEWRKKRAESYYKKQRSERRTWR